MSTAERSSLDDVHRALGAKMVPFGGWQMPLSYEAGTVEEHLTCRRDSVVFDVSHLGSVRIDGADSFELLQRALTNDLNKVSPGRAQYTHLLDANDGSVLDDMIVWWRPRTEHDHDVFDIMPNASNTKRVRQAIGGVETTHERAVLAVQGPRAKERLRGIFPEAADVKRFRVIEPSWNGVRCIVAGTGYTGEQGVEIYVPAENAAALWEAITSGGVTPAGLGARDTLRLEAALPLHGNELGPGITPLQARLQWVVAWDKGDFRGRQALAREQSVGVSRHLVGISTTGRRPPRSGCVVSVDGGSVGVVTSGNYSPVLEHGIALALVRPDVDVNTAVDVDVRGSTLSGRVVETPFV